MSDPQDWIIPRNWKRFQHRDALRSAEHGIVPWIRSYTRLLHDDAYIELSMSERGALHLVWGMYAAADGQLSATRVSRRGPLRVTRVQLIALNNAGFIEFHAGKPPRLSASSEKSRERTPPLPLPREGISLTANPTRPRSGQSHSPESRSPASPAARPHEGATVRATSATCSAPTSSRPTGRTRSPPKPRSPQHSTPQPERSVPGQPHEPDSPHHRRPRRLLPDRLRDRLGGTRQATVTTASIIRTAADVMTERQWQAFALVYVEQLTIVEAAHRLNIDESAVRRRLDRGLVRTMRHYASVDAPSPSQMAQAPARGGAPGDTSTGRGTDRAASAGDRPTVAAEPPR